MTPLALPGASPPRRSLLERTRGFLLRTWRGRILLGAAALKALAWAGAPLPELLDIAANLVLLGWLLVGFTRLSRFVMRRMLWKIRTKLILSYLFIAVVPVVLLTTLFVLAGVFFSGLLASHLVTAEVDRKARLLETAAESVLDGLALDRADLARVLPTRLAAARRVHPELSHALVSRGRTLSAQGSAPLTLPAWWKGGSFAGLVRTPAGELLRAVRTRGEAFLVLDVPLDGALRRAARAGPAPGRVARARDRPARTPRPSRASVPCGRPPPSPGGMPANR